MSVDYRLLAYFQASRDRYEAARRALPQHWLTDPRPEVQYLNELWVNMMARAEDQNEILQPDSPTGLPGQPEGNQAR
jgi:hypothetical protein